jgi:hypothetical protein
MIGLPSLINNYFIFRVKTFIDLWRVSDRGLTGVMYQYRELFPELILLAFEGELRMRSAPDREIRERY